MKITRTQLIENRRKAKIPDISYDLDNDGNVSGRDYFIARKFDQGCKHFLTKEEKETALDAIRNGVEDKYKWGLEAGAQMRGLRVKQVRG